MTGNAQNALLTNPTTGNITSQTAIYDFDFIYDGTDLVLSSSRLYNSYKLHLLYRLECK